MARIVSFSLRDKRDEELWNKVEHLAKSLDCSNSVIIRRALKSFFDEAYIDPLGLKQHCKDNPKILQQFKRVIMELEQNT